MSFMATSTRSIPAFVVAGLSLVLAVATGVAWLGQPLRLVHLLTIIGLSPGDWHTLGRGAGRGASRVALASGHGTAVAASLGRRLFRRWRR